MQDQRAFFDSRAKDWESRCYPSEVRARLKKLLSAFDIQEGMRVLDVGTGPGILYPYLRERIGSKGEVIAFDLSKNMIREARKKKQFPSDLFFQGDALQIAVRSNSFDLVLCFAAFPHFSNPALAMQEMARAAKFGAQVIIAHLLSREELARHHASKSSVAKDVLPEEKDMQHLFCRAGLETPEIVNIPGRYIAKGKKISEGKIRDCSCRI